MITRHPKAFLLLSVILVAILFSCSDRKTGYDNWEINSGTRAATRYSSLTEIDSSNVQQLQIAWTFHTNDADTINHSQIQCTPIVVDGILYGVSPQLKLFALDAATGNRKWIFDPFDSIAPGKKPVGYSVNSCRGITWWSNGKDKRIFYTAGGSLTCINADNGKPVTAFGSSGKIDLHDGLGRDVSDLYVTSTSAGIIYKDLLIIGTRVDEGPAAAPGHIRAYDVRTGKQAWIFHTIPQPGEFGYDTWEDSVAWKNIGGANSWSGFALDEKRGMLFAPVGSASYDFYGGKRLGNGLFSNCLLALDAATGKRIWHFQNVHHDVWDRDLPTAPALVTVMHNGKMTDAVAQPTKTGFLYLLNRKTGEPLFPVEEKAVPVQSELNGEKLSPTQPHSTLPVFARQSFTEADINPLLPDSSIAEIRNKLKSYQSGNLFNPPSKKGTVIFPGFDGAAEWGGPAFDPQTGIIYINANEMPWVLTMVDVKKNEASVEPYAKAGQRLYQAQCMSCHGPERKGSGNYPTLVDVNKKYNATQFYQLLSTGRRMMPAFKQLDPQETAALASFILDDKKLQAKQFVDSNKKENPYFNLPYTSTGYNKFLSREGYPAVAPPWGTMNAIDLNTGKMLWKIPLGTYSEFNAKGIVTGAENYGGPIVTAGGLLFIAATRDSMMRAFNKGTGKLLWETKLPVPGFATPAMYNIKGKQYLVIACGGGKLGTGSGDAYIAFALPNKQ